MVAYSFQKQFAEPIIAGTKQQTIRAIGKRRYVNPIRELQLYTGMRTRHCRLIGRAMCQEIVSVRLIFDPAPAVVTGDPTDPWEKWTAPDDLDAFARRDGFRDWTALAEFWAEHHPGLDVFDGTLIYWGNTFKAASISPPLQP